jgi:hypothetical protein
VKIKEGIEGDWRGRERRGEEDKKEEEGQLFKGKHYGEAKQERVSEWVVSPPHHYSQKRSRHISPPEICPSYAARPAIGTI